MWEQGITHVIATPHLRASNTKLPADFQRKLGEIDARWCELVNAATERIPKMKLDRGVELALDDPDPVVADPRLRLAGTGFVLVEFPWFTIPPNSTHPFERLRAGGYTPIVAHPERYENVDEKLDVLRDWKLQGALLQLNAGSLVGAYGPTIEGRAWQVLEAGLADYLCSDYHARGICLIRAGRERIAARDQNFPVKTLSGRNGERLLDGLPPVPVPPLREKKSRWTRLKRAIRGQ
jgi:protein-tyrosine phosphatase